MKKMVSLLLFFAMVISFMGDIANAAFDAPPTILEYDISANYTIEVPYSVDLNTTEAFSIRAYDVDLPDGQELVISIDTASTNFEENTLILTAENALDRKMYCNVCVVDETENGAGSLYSIYEADYVVAVFESGNEEPIKYGGLFFTPQSMGAKRGHYTCTMYYTVEVRDYL